MTQTNISTNMIGKITTLFCFAMVACTLNVHAQETKPLTNGVLFYSPCEHELELTGKQVPHRIPAIVKSGNTVIVFADKRYSGGDVGQQTDDTYGYRIDTKIRKSYDNGETWTKDITVIEGEPGEKSTSWGVTRWSGGTGYGDIAVVADRENSQNIVYFCVAGNTSFQNSSKGDDHLQIYRFRSSDGGNTWSNENITTEIYANANATLGNNFDCAFFSSGSILQSSKIKVGTHYRLYAAIHTKVNGWLWVLNKANATLSSTVVYSDDFGETWNRLGTTGTNVTITDGNEAKCQELPNGDIVVSSRTANGRIFNIFNYNSLPTSANTASGSWKTQAKASICNDSGTNGEFLIIKAVGKDGEGLYALQSMPAGPSSGGTGRSNLAIFYKKIGDEDGNAIGDNYTNPATFASGWKEAIRVSNTTSAYSSMTMLDEKTIGFVYEEDYLDYGSGAYDIKFKKFSIEEIVEPGSMLKTMAQSDCENYSWATFFFDQNMTLPEGVTAYVATEIVDRTITIKAIGNVVPAETPVILIDRQDRPTIYLTYGGTFDESKRPETNGLVGATEKIEITDNNYKNYYVVGHGSRHVGLYYPSNRGIASGLAYYPLSSVKAQNVSAKSSYGFVFAENTTTGIENIKTNTSIKDNTAVKDNTYYNLSGQAVKNPTKGIYILNGKKVIIK